MDYVKPQGVVEHMLAMSVLKLDLPARQNERRDLPTVPHSSNPRGPFSGFIAWWLWRTIYLMKLPRFEKKVLVALAWTSMCSFRRILSTSGPLAPPPRRRRKKNRKAIKSRLVRVGCMPLR